MAKQIFQIKVSLNGSKPKIWRRLLLEPGTELSNLHIIIQIAMGWENSHLHQFIKNRKYYLEPMDDGMLEDMGAEDYSGMTVAGLLKGEKDKMVYEYDFGDGWEHDVVLEKILPFDEKVDYPTCTAGKMNCPPEDCGGVWGYSDMLEILKDPGHEEYEDYLDWIGGEFDPNYFDKDKVNKLLKRARVK
jgi:Plasmid pRiA4b ORF-3-like protein